MGNLLYQDQMVVVVVVVVVELEGTGTQRVMPYRYSSFHDEEGWMKG